jgi:hypothetical protein
MNEQDFTEDMRTLAREVAQMLAGKTPYERALILHQAQEVWDTLREERLGREGALQASADDTFMDMTAAWVSAVCQEMPPSSRVDVLQLLSELQKNAQFDRLTLDVDISDKS